MLVYPEITEYNLGIVQEMGNVQKLDGILLGTDGETWYIPPISGIAYER